MDKLIIGILGAGSWGNTLAFLFAQNHKIILWDRDESKIRRLNKTRRFKRPSEQRYPDNVSFSSDLSTFKKADFIINAISLKGIEEVFLKLKNTEIPEDVIFINGSKGVDLKTLKTPSEIISGIFPKNPVAVLSGPNLAKELIKGKPMVTEIASEDIEIAKKIRKQLLNPTLRIYVSSDVKTIELCGAVKNIIAIAAGCSDGLELGASAKASLITRGLDEISRFVALYKGDPKTLMGAAGIGDLIATCSSDLSRNYRVGFYLSKGKPLDEIKNTLGEVAEGINTCFAVYQICQEHRLELPIVTQIKRVLNNEITTVEAVLNLMNRPLQENG
jgi:glycerol-3-phosphate dehydrogenase (NAD(P)+)